MPAADSLYRVLRFQEQNGAQAVTLLGPEGVVEPFERFVVLEALSSVKSFNTILGYAYDLKHWFTWLHLNQHAWDRVKWEALTRFVDWLRYGEQLSIRERVIPIAPTQKRAETSIARILSSLYAFYAFHMDTPMAESLRKYQGHGRARRGSKRSKFVAVRPVRARFRGSARPDSLTDEELDALLDACNTHRDRLLITLLGRRGMRVGQALGLRHEDINTRQGTYTIVPRTNNVNGARAKTDRPWTLPLRPDMVELLKDYMHEEYGDLDCDYLFVNLEGSNKGQPMGYKGGADKLRQRLVKKTSIDFSLHTLRHTFATLAISRGVPMAVVQTMLTHKDASTTASTYIHLKAETLRRYIDGGVSVETVPPRFIDSTSIQEIRQQLDAGVKRI